MFGLTVYPVCWISSVQRFEHKSHLKQQKLWSCQWSNVLLPAPNEIGVNCLINNMQTCVQVLGDRWAAICRWTEERWLLLQEILLKWQHFTNEQVP